MSLRESVAWWYTRWLYRRPVVADTARSRWFFAVRNATPRKVRNYLRQRRDYRAGVLEVASRPYALRVDPSSACNLRCPLCPTGAGEVDRGAHLLPLDTFSRILDELAPDAFLVHLWVWGEPLLHKQLWRMVQMAEAAGVGTEVNSNFSLKLDDEDIERLVRSGLSWLVVSVDGTHQESYARYRRGGQLDRVLDNIRRVVAAKRALKQRTPFVEWQFVPFKHNETERDEAWRMARELGVDGLRFKPSRLDKTGDLSFSGQPIPVTLADEWRPADASLRNDVGDAGDHFLDHHCPMLWGYATILSDGAIAPCCETYKREHDVAQVGERPFGEIWNGADFQRMRAIALGRAHDEADRRFACYGCRVYSKPELPGPRPSR